uniref:Uncharacterized protein n=1 Tax=Arundo donax TaxID=35708 RepID=A0A0A9CUN0_ARUDO
MEGAGELLVPTLVVEAQALDAGAVEGGGDGAGEVVVGEGEGLEAGHGAEEVRYGADEAAVVELEGLELLRGGGEVVGERPAAGGGVERVVGDGDLEESVETREEVGGDGVEGVVVEEDVLEGGHAAEGGERAGEAVALEAEVLECGEGGDGGGEAAGEAAALEVEVVDPAGLVAGDMGPGAGVATASLGPAERVGVG